MDVAKEEMRKVVKIVEQVLEVPEITLVLSNDEAETLMLVLRRVSGYPRGSRRKDTQATLQALQDAGVACLDRYDARANMIGHHGVSGDIHFKVVS